jgi:hypothetical protein
MEQQLLKIGSLGSFFEVDFTIIILLLFLHLNSSLPTDTVCGIHCKGFLQNEEALTRIPYCYPGLGRMTTKTWSYKSGL